MEKRSFVQGAAVLAIAGLIVKIIGAVYRIPLNNIVGLEGMGYYDIVYRYYAWLLVISSGGLPTAISKLVSERVTMGDHRGARQVFRTAFVLLAGIGLATSLFMFFGSDFLAGISYSAESAAEIPKQALSFRALAPSLLFVSLMCAYRGYLQGLQRMEGTAASQIMEQVGKLAVGFYLAMRLLPMGPEYAAMGALIGVSASELLALIVIYIFYLRRKPELDRAISRAPKRAVPGFAPIAKKLLAIALPVTIGASIMPITGIVDSAFIIRILEGLGYTVEQARNAYALLYSYVTPIINMPAVLSLALAMSLVPAISSYMAKKDYPGVRAAARTGLKLALLIGTPCAVGLFVLAEPILHMLFSSLEGAELTLGAELLMTACIGVVFLTLVQTLTGIIQGLGKPNVPVVNLLFGGTLKIATLFLLAREPGINIQGAAVSTVVCYASAGILDVVYLARKTGLKLQLWDTFGKPIAASALMGAAVYFLHGALGSLSSTAATILAVFVGVILYLALVILLRMLDESDLAFIPGGRHIARIVHWGKKTSDRH